MIKTASLLLELTRFYKSAFFCLLIFLLVPNLSYTALAFLFFIFSYSFNDYVDLEMDKITHPNRPLPSGRLSKRVALNFIVVVSVLTVLLSLYSYPVFILLTLLSALYSRVLKRYVPSVAIFFWIGLVVYITLSLTQLSIALWVVVYSLFMARELLLDIRDAAGDDVTCKTPSLQSIAGLGFISFLICLLVVIAGVASFLAGAYLITVFSSFMFLVLLYLCLSGRLEASNEWLSKASLLFLPLLLTL